MLRASGILLGVALLALAAVSAKAWQYRMHAQQLNAEIFKLTFEPSKAQARGDYQAQNAEALAISSGRATVIFGDSIAQRWGRPIPGSVNRGIGGETTAEMTRRFDRDVLALKPRAVVIVGGANDLHFAPQGGPCRPAADRAVRNLVAMADRAKEAGIAVTVVGLPSPNVPGKALKGRCWTEAAHMNAALRSGGQYRFLDTEPALAIAQNSDDGLHPSRAGYERLTAALAR